MRNRLVPRPSMLTASAALLILILVGGILLAGGLPEPAGPVSDHATRQGEPVLVGRSAQDATRPEGTTPQASTEDHEAPAPATKHLTVQGIVTTIGGEPLPDVHVRVLSPSHRTIEVALHCTSDAAGRFKCAGEVPSDSPDCLVTGTLERGAEAFVLYPAVRRLSEGDSTIDCWVVATRGSVVRGSVGSESTAVLISQRPDRRDPYQGWNRHGLRTLDRLVDVPADRQFSSLVRPGPLRVRAIGPGGELGPAVEATVDAGEVVTVGVLPSPLPAQPISLLVRTQGGDPVQDAWVQLSNRELCALSPDGLDGLPHFRTGVDGSLRLPPLALEDYPLDIAAGSPRHDIEEIRLRGDEPSPVVITVREREHLIVRLIGPGVAGLGSEGLSAVRVVLVERTRPHRPVMGRPSPAEALAVALERFESGVEDTGAATLWVDCPLPGPYDVRVMLGATTLGSTRLTVDADAHSIPAVDVEIEAGRIVPLELHLPPKVSIRAAKSFLRGSWIVRGEAQSMGHAMDVRALLDRVGEQMSAWAPMRYDSVCVWSEHPCLLPVSPFCARLSLDAVTRLAPAALPDSGILQIRVCATAGVPARDVWPLRIVSPEGRDNAPRRLVHELTDASGRLEVRLGTGKYEIRSGLSFRKPYASVEADVATGESTVELETRE